MASTAVSQILATVTATVAETTLPTATASASAAPVPVFSDTFWGFAAFEDIVLFMTGVLVAFILGDFNRLIAIPIIGPLCACLANTINWHGWNFPGYSKSQMRGMIITSEIFYSVQALVLPLYSFFLLETILSGMERRVYLAVYCTIYTGIWLLQVPMIFFAQRFLDDNTAATGIWEDHLSWGYYILIASLELWSAYFLIKSFYRARKNAKMLGISGRWGLFTALMRSSEIRVASLCTTAILRLATYRSFDNGSPALETVAHFAFAVNQTFPVVLQLDLVASKMLKLQNAAMSLVPAGGLIAPREDVEKNSCSDDGKGVVDSVSREFRKYGIGSGWSSKESSVTMRSNTTAPRSQSSLDKVPEADVQSV